jgi:hypothetical protein
LPELRGAPIAVRFLPELRVYRGKLHSNQHLGRAVHAASHIRKREMILDRSLNRQRKEFERILIHELFHFVWARLGNPARQSYLELIAREESQRARGELGWSAALAKQAERRGLRDRIWRDYVCESFCDTAAWMYSGMRVHDEFTLAIRFKRARRAWFRERFDGQAVLI